MVGSGLPQPVVVRVMASDGMAVAGAAVSFSAAAGDKMSPSTATSDVNGLASATLTLPQRSDLRDSPRRRRIRRHSSGGDRRQCSDHYRVVRGGSAGHRAARAEVFTSRRDCDRRIRESSAECDRLVVPDGRRWNSERFVVSYGYEWKCKRELRPRIDTGRRDCTT